MFGIRTIGGGGTALALSTLLLTACSGSSGGGGSLSVVSCSLGCSGSGVGGDGQVSCGIADVFLNTDIRVTFSQPVDPASLTVFTFQVTDVITGKAPTAQRFVDPENPEIVVYRPSLTFDSSGLPVFGLGDGASYTLKIPGVVQDPGVAYVRSESGLANHHRMLCTLEASLGVLDPKPGAPTITPLVDVVTGYDPITGEPSAFDTGVGAAGADNVYRFSDIAFEFDDLMNPGTLVNPVDGTSTTISVWFDPDGVTTDPSDQLVVHGSFAIILDTEALTTRVVFVSDLGFPSAGTDPLNPRKVVVKLSPGISDLGGNVLTNPDDIVFTPEVVLFPEEVLNETFAIQNDEDTTGGGADWGGEVPGALLPGLGGGSGELGRLSLASGESVVLNTDFEDFSGLTVEQWNPADSLVATFDGVNYTVPPVTDGIFEFASLNLPVGSEIRFEGSQPARLFVRGEAFVRGAIDVSAEPGFEHDGTNPLGGTPSMPGPGGAPGGDGGRLPTWEGFEGVLGVIVPEDPLLLPPTLAELDGVLGEGVVDNLLTPTGTYGAGQGGIAWPQPHPSVPGFYLPADPDDILGMEWDAYLSCTTKMKGSVGAGGGFGLNGGSGANKPIPGGLFAPTEAPTSSGGLASDFGIGIGSDPELPQRTLLPEDGWLHGGSGGGGGGGHIGGNSQTNGTLFFDCYNVGGQPAGLKIYTQSSSAAGGSGGGAMQVQVGRRLTLDGELRAVGGKGGSKLATKGNTVAGGGGSGGSILLQSPEIFFSTAPGRINIAGGEGGFGSGGSTGGRGGAGLLRIEQQGLAFPSDQLAFITAPSEADLADVGASPSDIQSSGVLTKSLVGPSGVSGAQSCWIQPDGVFFTLDFLADGAELGWDMLVDIDGVLNPQSFRGPNVIFADTLENLFGNDLGTSPVVVRFQGVRIIKAGASLCDLELNGAESPIQPGSLTGWVDHPSELNAYFTDPELRSNAFRFQILFDETQPTADVIESISEIFVRVQPD